MTRGRIVTLCALAAVLSTGCGSEGVPTSRPSTAAPSAEGTGAASRVPGPTVREALTTSETALIRTDFSDDAAWLRIVDVVTAPDTTDTGSEYGAYEPNIATAEDRGLDGWSVEDLVKAWDKSERSGYVLVADAQSIQESRKGGLVTVAYVDLNESDLAPGEVDEYGMTAEDYGTEYGRSFRCQLEQVASIEANLSIANMDFFEFADTADRNDGVFTGFEGE